VGFDMADPPNKLCPGDMNQLKLWIKKKEKKDNTALVFSYSHNKDAPDLGGGFRGFFAC
jgi:hypothetical protein